MGSLGGVTGVGGDPSLAHMSVRDKDKVKEAELSNLGFISLVLVSFICTVNSYLSSSSHSAIFFGRLLI